MATSQTDAAGGIIQAIEQLAGRFNSIEKAVTEMAKAIGHLAVMEERQLNDRKAVERAFHELAEQNKQLAVLKEQIAVMREQQVLNKQTNGWVERALWAAAVFGVMAFFKLGEK